MMSHTGCYPTYCISTAITCMAGAQLGWGTPIFCYTHIVFSVLGYTCLASALLVLCSSNSPCHGSQYQMRLSMPVLSFCLRALSP